MAYIVKQRDLKDCGICCIESLILYYNGYVPMERLRKDTYVTKEGVSAFHIIETLKKYGFEAYGSKIKEKEVTNALILPAIVHLKLKKNVYHFAVLLKVSKNKVTLMDPAKGKVVMSKIKFFDIWTNIIIFAYPKKKIPKLDKEEGIKKVFLKLMHYNKKYIFLFLIFSFLFGIIVFLLSFYQKISLEHLAFNKDEKLLFLIFLFGSLTLLKLFIASIKEHIENIIEKNMEGIYLYSFLRHIFRLPMFQFTSHQKGELLERIREIKAIENGFFFLCFNSLSDLLFFSISFILLYFINKMLLFVLVSGLIIYILLGLIWAKSLYKEIYKNIWNEEVWNNTLDTYLELFISMKHLNQTNFILTELEKGECSYLNEQYKLKEALRKQNFLKNLIIEATTFITISLGIYLISKNELSIYDFLLLISLMHYFIEPIEKLVGSFPNFYYLKGIISKINEFSHLEIEHLESSNKLVNGVIEFQNVYYSYNNYQNILEKVSFKIKKGSHILLDGPSGCGKSTICKILCREIDGYKGKITIRSRNLLDYSLGIIRNSITYLSQEEKLFNGTIKENIIFGRNISDEDFFKVCELCQIEKIIENRPLRYNEYIEKESEVLSGGEKQRIILARALLNDGEIYMLDECLSEVEETLEKEIVNNIMKYLKDKTVIYITHKPNKLSFDEVINLA